MYQKLQKFIQKNRKKEEHTEHLKHAGTIALEAAAPEMSGERDIKQVQTTAFCGQGAREDQQDSFCVEDAAEKGVLAVVADGMGGLKGGDKVSGRIADICRNVIRQLPQIMAAEDILLEMAIQCQEQVNAMLQGGPRSGSTLAAAMIRDGYLHFLTVGDSRIYLYRGGALLTLNRSHVYREELALMAVNGMLTPSRIHSDPQAKSLTGYFGNGRLAYLDRNTEGIKLLDKDRILVASDGVFETLTSEQMEHALGLPLEESGRIMNQMIEEAKRSYQDNYTGIIAEYRIES